MSDIKIGQGILGKWYAGKTRVLKNGTEIWTSKSDVTEYINAICQEKDQRIIELQKQVEELKIKLGMKALDIVSMDVNTRDKRIAVLERALELACIEYISYTDEVEITPLYNDFIRQAEKELSKNE